jgi:putative transposase
VLLLVSVPQPAALARFVQGIGRRYVRVFNRRHGRRGPLWDGRFRSTVVDPASLLLTCLRLIEQAPVRRGLVAQASDWPWSSAVHHAGQRTDSILTVHDAYWQLGNTPFERQARHAREVGVALAPDEVAQLLAAAHHGWPLGSEGFLRSLAAQTERPVRRRPRGRPRRVEATTA